MRSQYEEGLWITSVRLGLSGQEDRVLRSNYVDPWISDSPPTPGVSIRQRPRLVPGGVCKGAGWATRIPLRLQVIHPAASRVTRTDVAVRGPDNLGHGRTVLQYESIRRYHGSLVIS